MTLLDERAAGVYIIAVTPFTDTGAIDLASTDRMVEFYLDRGATGLTILGMMGEAPKLSVAESVAFSRHVVRRVAGRVPVVAGASSPGFAAMRELARAVMDDGAAGVMVAPVPGVRTDDAVFGYFAQVAETLGGIPWVLQDFPQSTGVQIAPSVIRRVVEADPSCVMLKHEDWPGLAKISALRDMAGTRRIAILVGNGGVFLPEELRRGADGAMTGFAFPEMMAGVYAAHLAGDEDRASDIFDAYLPLARYEQQPGPGLAVRKYILHKRGAIASAAQRRPGSTLGAREIEEVEFLLARQARRVAAIG
ncbi:MAG: dihydrodipicolinate synthase family protein [Rhodospirillales bacterium 70-18]|nr:dihydrodipicolinate synthase family protein [Rhodospirillales bacterium]OJY63438.1 MAG: dihydrodipicolinate synthase family protein [Rhodospirillales bacterium 70-18]